MIPAGTGTSLTVTLASLALLAGQVSAQVLPTPPQQGLSQDDKSAAYFALTTTPVGAFAEITDMPGVAGRAGRIQIHGQLGFADQEGPFSIRNFALGLSIPGASGVLRLTAGIADFACDDEPLFAPGDGFDLECGTGYFAGVDGTIPLIRPAMTGTSSEGFAASLVVSLGASTNDVVEVEYEDLFDPTMSGRIEMKGRSLSGAVGVPLSFVARSEGIVVIPHLTPRIGYGHGKMDVDISVGGIEDQMESSGGTFRPMLGAGVDILFANSGFGAGFGIQRVFADEGEMVLGINLSYRPR